jgi:hypothetical protein
MSKMISITALATALAGAALALPAQAQVGVEFGIGRGGPRVETYERDPYRPVVERRSRRVIVEDDEEECRMVVRRRMNQYGEMVERRTRVCE